MSNQSKVLAVGFGLLCFASLSAAAEHLSGTAGVPGLTALEHRMLRQAENYVRIVIERAQSRSRLAPAGNQDDSLTLIGRQVNIAVGKGSVACSSIGGFDEAPRCVSGDDTIATQRRE